MPNEYIGIEKEDVIATIILNRPEKHNALSQGLLAELRVTFDEIDTDNAIRVVVLTGAGRQAFSTGLDLNPRELTSDAPHDEADWSRLIRLDFETLMRIWNLR